MEIHRLVQLRGYLSPELVIGWQVGKYAEEFFAGLEEVAIAAARDDDAVLALTHLGQHGNRAGQVLVANGPRPWDFLFYHPTTGTMLAFTLNRRRTCLPRAIRKLEAQLDQDHPAVVSLYQACLNLLIQTLLGGPIQSFCQIRQRRCRRLPPRPPSGRQLHCHSCGQPLGCTDGWDVEGEIRCCQCCGLEPDWYGSNH
ncbi:hypothetical protein [Desulfolithobacter sp.]